MMNTWIKIGLTCALGFSLVVKTCSQTPKPEKTYVIVQKKTDSSNAKRSQLIKEAEKLIGVRYCSASSSPQSGFDCSGFVWYVFNKIGMEVPRSSSAFLNFGKEVKPEDAKPGDIIVFTGTTNFNKSQPGHVGIVYKTDNPLQFIHSTSGKAYGVTIMPLEKGYVKRFIKIVRVIN